MKQIDFYISGEFMTHAGRWRCTDTGHRTIAAIKIDDPGDDPSWLEGPPYGVVEMVFDESDFGGCWETERS